MCIRDRPRDPSKRVDVDIHEKRDNTKNEEMVIGRLMREMTVVMNRCSLALVFSYMELNLFLEKM